MGREAPGKEGNMQGKRIKGRKQKQINYLFFKKPMATRLGTMRRAAVSENTKVATAVAEFQRRWKNCSEGTPKEVMFEISRDYADDLLGMGYPREWIEKILDKALTGYERVLRKVSLEETRRNRLGDDTKTSRRFKKL